MIAGAIPPVGVCREVSTGSLIDSSFSRAKNSNTYDYNRTVAQNFRKFWHRAWCQKVLPKS
jgi:hypothetical protein